MGGKNHQPCKKYLPNSTEVSRATSLALAELELANVAIEDLILAELADGVGTVTNALEHLHASRRAISSACAAAGRLREHMEAESFRDLPTLRRVNLDTLGDQLAERNIVDAGAWARISELMNRAGFFCVLAHFDTSLDRLADKTDRLIECISELTDTVSRGGLTQLVEGNEPGNFKIPFAILYNAWSIFQLEFVASSMLSTELWYRHTECGSLVEVPQPIGALA